MEEAAQQLDEVMQDPLFSRWELRAERGSGGRALNRNSWLSSYSDRTNDLFESFFDWLFNRSRNPSPSNQSSSQTSGNSGWDASLGDFLKTIGWVVLAGAVSLSLWMIISQILNRRGTAAGTSPDRLTLETALDEADALAVESRVWTQHAQQLAHEDNLRLAFRATYLALLSGLHQAGKISYRPQRTNSWYVRGYRGQIEERQVFSELTKRFGEIWYGQEIPDQISFDHISREVNRLLRSASEPSGLSSTKGHQP